LIAEAFNISVDVKTEGQEAQAAPVLNFDLVRAGEPKIQKMNLKNNGIYPVKF
jgi:hypothetical protein